MGWEEAGKAHYLPKVPLTLLGHCKNRSSGEKVMKELLANKYDYHYNPIKGEYECDYCEFSHYLSTSMEYHVIEEHVEGKTEVSSNLSEEN